MQWAGYLSTQKRISICLLVVCSRKKTSRVVEEMLHWSFQVCYGNSGKIKIYCKTRKHCGFFVHRPCKFHALSNSLHEIPHGIPNFHPQLFPCLQTYCLGFFFYWNSLIQKNSWAMTSSEWKLYVAAKLLTNFKHLKGISTFLLILDKKHLTYKISNERRVAIASVVGLDNLSLNLWIIILRSIT